MSNRGYMKFFLLFPSICFTLTPSLFADYNDLSGRGMKPPPDLLPKIELQENNVSLEAKKNIETVEPLASVESNTSFLTNPSAVNVTLKEAVEKAITQNSRVKQAKERVKQSDYMVREAFAEFLPEITLSADEMRKKYDGFDIQDYSQSEYMATLSYNLFSSGKDYAQWKKNKLVKQEQEEKYKGTMQEEIMKVIDAYCSVVYGRKSFEVNQMNYDKLVKVYEIVQKKRELGAATAGDESSIKSSVANAKTALINTESAYNNAKDYYEFLIGQNLESMNPYEDSFNVKVGEFEPIFAQIEEGNADLNIIRAKIEQKKKDVDINEATDLPTLDFTYNNTRRHRNDYVGTDNGYNTDIWAQLTLSYNFYTGGRTEAKTARAMSEVQDNLYNLEYTTQETKWDSQKLHNSVQTNARTIETLETEIKASERMTEAYWERFRLASQDLIVLLQAQRQLNAAQLEKIRSEKAQVVDYFNLLSKQGKLLEYFNF